MDPSPTGAAVMLEYGIVGAALLVVYKVLSVAQAIFLNKRGMDIQGDDPKGAFPVMPCQTDPIHHQRLKEIHSYTTGVQKEISEGKFGCAWKDRDEVTEMLQAMRLLVRELHELTLELRQLTKGK